MIHYRPYQTEAGSRSLAALEQHQRALVVLPTGTGKSLVIRWVVEQTLASGRGPVLIVVHKRELVDQLSETMRTIPSARVVVEQAETRELTFADRYDVAVCSKQTLESRPEVLDGEVFGLVVVDETHRILAEGYLELMGRVGTMDGGRARLLGCTATDFRADKKELRALYQTVAYKKRGGLVGFIEDGWLVPIRARRVALREALGLSITDRALDPEELVDAAWDVFSEHCMEEGRAVRPTLVMAQNLPQGRLLAGEFTARGVRAEMVDSKMDQALRDRYVREFRDGGLDVLVGFDVPIEGFDAPRSSCLLWLRNTGSPVVFAQALGRITRPFFTDAEAFRRFNESGDADERKRLIAASDKPDALFFDFVDTASRYDVVTLGEVVGLGRSFDFEGEDVADVLARVDELTNAYGVLSTDTLESASHIALVTEEVDLWRKAIRPNQGVPDGAELTWVHVKDEWRCSFPGEKGSDTSWVLHVSETPLGEWEVAISQPVVWKEWYYRPGQGMQLKFYRGKDEPDTSLTVHVYKNGGRSLQPKYVRVSGMPKETLLLAPTKGDAFAAAEAYVGEHFPESVWNLAHKEAPWRRRRPSPGQAKVIAKMRKKGIGIPEDPDSGTASVLIDLFFQGILKPVSLKKKARRTRPGK